jgi:Domain of unknown function (DU1801)
MIDTKSKTVAAYLQSLPSDRRAALQAVHKAILDNLDDEYEEGMLYGMIGYYVPHELFPAGYHCDPSKPLCYAGLASQKNHMAVYLMCIYGSPELRSWFEKAWAKSGKKLDMGKSCIRFKKADDLALDVIGEAIRRVPAKKYIAEYVRVLEERGKSVPVRKPEAKAGAKRGRSRTARASR